MDIIAKPFGWLLMTLYDFIGNYGLAVIVFALIVRAIQLPFQMKSKRGTLKQARLTPKVKELEKKHGANKQKYQEEVSKLYKEEKVNPASGCIWGLIPLPIIIALFSAVSRPLTIMMGVARDLLMQGGAIYNLLEKLGGPIANARYLEIEQVKFVSANFDAFSPLSNALRPLDYNFLGMKLGDTPQWNFLWTTNWHDVGVWGPGLLLFLMAISSAALSFVSSRLMMKFNPMANQQQGAGSAKSMMLLMPLMSLYFAFYMPGAISVYIIVSTLFQTVQDIILTKRYNRILDAEDAVRLEQQRVKEAELEAKRLETERRRLQNSTEKNRNTSKKKQLKNERQEQIEKTVEWVKKQTGTEQPAADPSRVGERRYARGRAYDPSRFDKNEASGTDEPVPDEVSPDEVSPDEAPEDEDGGVRD